MVEDDDVMMSGPPFVEYDIAQFNDVRGPVGKAVEGSAFSGVCTKALQLKVQSQKTSGLLSLRESLRVKRSRAWAGKPLCSGAAWCGTSWRWPAMCLPLPLEWKT